ncbi:hypothetical protein [Streptomyces qinglanensis]|uniref:hypothetical protein n=1 Tax=Streptomyces qinglanensis TaxID=943816 RepID=UPI003D724437
MSDELEHRDDERRVGPPPERGPHRPTYSFGQPPVARCPDCCWAQELDEDLHEDREDVLLTWHSSHPADAVDHLVPLVPGRLAVPPYVRWQETGGRVAVHDERTGEAVLFNHECLAIFRSVAAGEGLEGAVTPSARRLGISPSRARSDIKLIGTSLFRKGLLVPGTITVRSERER